MSNTELDTDTLLAILSSLLDHPIQDQHVLLDALVQCNGEVDAAAHALNVAHRTRVSSKRPVSGILDDWLNSSVAESGKSNKKSKVALTTAASTRPVAPARSPPQSATGSKPLTPLAEVLHPPPPTSPTKPRLPPLILSNPTLVQKHTTCTLHLRVLPPELALKLFQVMVDASKEWKQNKWWLFDRVVESPHKTSFYARRVDGISNDTSWQEAARYWYNGRPTPPPQVFPPEMEEACQIVEKAVNDVILTRPRFSLEWGGTGSTNQNWKANVAAANCYTGAKEGVGFHSDQLTYLGPYPTIASLSLGATRTFRLREVIPKTEADKRQPQTFNIPLVHNSLVIMHAGTQERFKHSIPKQNVIDPFHPSVTSSSGPEIPSNYRINITFRFYRPDFRPASIPRCRCDIPCVLRADMKGREESSQKEKMRYFWMCYGGAQNEGRGCSYFEVMDVKQEGRGPFVGDR